MRFLLAVVCGMVLVGMVTDRLFTVTAQPEPVVKVGQTYILVESCTAATGNCFGELHRVTAVLPNQWVQTLQCLDETCVKTGRAWMINLARVYALRPHRPDSRDAD